MGRVIRTIIFDLGRVLIPFDFDRGYRRMSEHCGLAPDVIRQRLRASGLVPELESGRVEARWFVQRVAEMMEADITYEDFRTIWSSIFLPATLIPESFVVALRQNYRLVLLSNTNQIHYEMLREAYSILGHFDAYVLSHEVRAMKPDPAIYQAAVDAAQCAPPECFYTDDIPAFVEGARAQGIDAVLFESYEQIQRELAGRGVRW
jgi:FMN phosphatase YigB (HAD superfamily)